MLLLYSDVFRRANSSPFVHPTGKRSHSSPSHSHSPRRSRSMSKPPTRSDLERMSLTYQLPDITVQYSSIHDASAATKGAQTSRDRSRGSGSGCGGGSGSDSGGQSMKTPRNSSKSSSRARAGSGTRCQPAARHRKTQSQVFSQRSSPSRKLNRRHSTRLSASPRRRVSHVSRRSPNKGQGSPKRTSLEDMRKHWSEVRDLTRCLEYLIAVGHYIRLVLVFLGSFDFA